MFFPFNLTNNNNKYTILTYLLTYLLTPWCRTLFEKLIATQPVKKILLSLWNPKVHYRVHESPPLDPNLSQSDPVRPIDPYLPKVQLKDKYTTNYRKVSGNLQICCFE
jgi:hypothetical protein